MRGVPATTITSVSTYSAPPPHPTRFAGHLLPRGEKDAQRVFTILPGAVPAAIRPPMSLDALLAEIRACRACAAELPHEPRPVVQVRAETQILVLGQAPGGG
jgi:hypothetical protein